MKKYINKRKIAPTFKPGAGLTFQGTKACMNQISGAKRKMIK